MNRAIVLILCLTAAGAVAGYTHYSQQQPSEQTPVFTVRVPQRAAEPAQSAPPPPQKIVVAPGDRVSLARALQRELKRVGCYSGDINGVWTTSSRMAMKSFTDKVNATLPIDNPDPVLLSLVQGHPSDVCPPGAAPAGSRVDAASADSRTDPPAEASAITTGSVVPSTAAAATALATTAAITKPGPKANTSETHPAAATPDEAPPKSGGTERSRRESGPVPSERVYDRRSHRHSNRNKPPKFVRNILRAFGIR